MAVTPTAAPFFPTPGTAALTKLAAEIYLPSETVNALYPDGAHPSIPSSNDGDALARAAARFAPFAADTPSLDEIKGILARPAVTIEDKVVDDSEAISLEIIDRYVAGDASYPRMEMLHVALSGKGGPEKIVSIENGPSALPHVSMVIASMGGSVIVREPDDISFKALIRTATRKLPLDWLWRMDFDRDMDAIDRPSPAQISYWINPTARVLEMHTIQARTPERLAMLADYLGRDVILGGYLVIQTDRPLYSELIFDPMKWRYVFDSAHAHRGVFEGIVFPTGFVGVQNDLRIFRRIAL